MIKTLRIGSIALAALFALATVGCSANVGEETGDDEASDDELSGWDNEGDAESSSAAAKKKLNRSGFPDPLDRCFNKTFPPRRSNRDIVAIGTLDCTQYQGAYFSVTLRKKIGTGWGSYTAPKWALQPTDAAGDPSKEFGVDSKIPCSPGYYQMIHRFYSSKSNPQPLIGTRYSNIVQITCD